MPYRRAADGSFDPPYDRNGPAVKTYETGAFKSPPDHVLPMLAFYRADDHPGQVYNARRRQWVPDADDAYLRWKAHPWAVETSHADEDAVADHMHGLGKKGADFAPPNSRRRQFTARELFAVLTDEDVASIQIALDTETAHAKSEKAGGRAAKTPLRLLWASLQVQGDGEIDVTHARFQAGWAGIRQALTVARATEIASALNIREPA